MPNLEIRELTYELKRMPHTPAQERAHEDIMVEYAP